MRFLLRILTVASEKRKSIPLPVQQKRIEKAVVIEKNRPVFYISAQYIKTKTNSL